MGILGSRTGRSWGFGGRRGALFSAGTRTTSLFEGEHASGGRERGAWRGTAELVRTSPFCSGARGEARRTALRGGKRGDDHEVSILNRLGDEDRAGRAPTNVSTMIIRPPQHGHRCAGEGVSASVSASAGGGSGTASNRRMRSMLRARTVPPNRP